MVKKRYVKPQMLIDSFEMSESIAAGCELISNMAERICPVEIKEIGLIYISDLTCDWTPPGGEDSICYHAPEDDNNVFGS